MKKFRTIIGVGLLCTMLSMNVFATGVAEGGSTETVTSETTSETITSEVSSESLETQIIQNTNVPYLALGADLSDSQLDTVLSYMGIAKADLANYKVVYVTNAQEHQYLDEYIDSSVIGSKALSCVMIKESAAGSGLRVTTRNINYCTINMYRNALITAGVENADIYVAGPSQISGTAALIGAMFAYEEMSGEVISEERKTAALAELVTIGQVLEEGDDAQAGKLEELIEYVKAEVIANDLTDIADINEVIEAAQEEYDLILSEEQKQMIADLMEKIAGLDIDPTKLLEQAGDLYDKYGETILADAKEMLDGIFTEEVKTTLWEQIKGIFTTLWDAVSNWFSSDNSAEETSE